MKWLILVLCNNQTLNKILYLKLESRRNFWTYLISLTRNIIKRKIILSDGTMQFCETKFQGWSNEYIYFIKIIVH